MADQAQENRIAPFHHEPAGPRETFMQRSNKSNRKCLGAAIWCVFFISLLMMSSTSVLGQSQASEGDVVGGANEWGQNAESSPAAASGPGVLEEHEKHLEVLAPFTVKNKKNEVLLSVQEGRIYTKVTDVAVENGRFRVGQGGISTTGTFKAKELTLNPIPLKETPWRSLGFWVVLAGENSSCASECCASQYGLNCRGTCLTAFADQENLQSLACEDLKETAKTCLCAGRPG